MPAAPFTFNISVPYKPLLEDEHGFREGVHESGGLYADVPYLIPNWDDRYTFANEMCGISQMAADGKTWTLTPPQRYPPSPNMFAMSTAIRGVGEPVIAPDTIYPRYAQAVVTVAFRSPHVRYGDNDPNRHNQLAHTPEEQEALQYADQDIDYATEYLSIPGTHMQYETSGESIKTMPVRMTTYVQVMTITYHRLPFLPNILTQRYVGCINAKPFLGCVPESVIFLGASTKRQIDTSGFLLQQAVLKFKWRNVSWNKDPLPDGSGWDYVKGKPAAGRVALRKFGYADLLMLLRFNEEPVVARALSTGDLGILVEAPDIPGLFP